jgi:hypothetical protein
MHGCVAWCGGAGGSAHLADQAFAHELLEHLHERHSAGGGHQHGARIAQQRRLLQAAQQPRRLLAARQHQLRCCAASRPLLGHSMMFMAPMGS